MRIFTRMHSHAFHFSRDWKFSPLIPMIAFLLLLFSVSLGQRIHREAVTVEILLKLLLENQQRDFSSGRPVGMAIIFDTTDAIAKDESERYRRTFQAVADSLQRFSLWVQDLPIQQLSELSGTRFQTAFLHRVPPDSLERVLQRCAEERVLTLTTDTSSVARGASVGVYIDEAGEPRIWLNVRSLNDEGASFPRHILKLAEQLIY